MSSPQSVPPAVSAPAATTATRWLEFSKVDHLVGFLLTCHEEPTCGPGCELYERQLDRILIGSADKQLRLWVQIQGSAALVQLASSMALANSAKVLPKAPSAAGAAQGMTKLQLMQRICLEPMLEEPRSTLLLAGFRGARPEQLGQFLEWTGQLGARNVEVAFVSKQGAGFSHFVRLVGVRDLKALAATAIEAKLPVELYVPVKSERAIPRFYTQLGWNFPVRGLERLARVDSELVVLRPLHPSNALDGTQWVRFAPGEANFFRRMAECVDLQLSAAGQEIVNLQEEQQPRPVPLELTLTPRPAGPPTQLVEIDRQIDRHQRLLSELNRARERFTSSDTDEVCFAYCFDQVEGEALNPLLAALMQQRVGVLRHLSYAWCEPRNGRSPFHLVVARRPQRHEGFSLLAADRVYFQPLAWRRAEVPLFLPWGLELSPRIDSRDAVELLQRFLEESDAKDGGRRRSDLQPAIAACPAVLWERGSEGEIVETRVQSLVGILDQFQILNAFCRDVATTIDDATRKGLEDNLAASRARIDNRLENLTRDLYQHVAQRTESLETEFNAMVQQLKDATTLVERVEKYARQVTDLMQKAPGDWATFVSRVIEVHRKITQPAHEAYQELRERLKPTAQDLKMLAVRGRNLAEQAVHQRQRLERGLEECNQMVVQSDNLRESVGPVAQQVAQVVRQVVSTHDSIAPRLSKIDLARADADRMELAIDECQQREQEVRERIKQLQPEYQRCERLDAELKTLEAEVAVRAGELRQRNAELAATQQLRLSHSRQIVSQLQSIELQLRQVEADNGVADHLSARLDEEMRLVGTQVIALELWEAQSREWRLALEQDLASSRDRIATAQDTGNTLGEAGSLLRQAQELIDRGEQLVRKLPRREQTAAAETEVLIS